MNPIEEISEKTTGFAVVGKRVPRWGAAAFVTGKAKFSGDIQFPGMLHVKWLRSPYPNAVIKKIDTSKAEAMQGVSCVLTYKDDLPSLDIGTDGRGGPLLLDKVYFVGDEVAAVAAESEDIAEEACDLIDVEYEQRPFVIDLEDALKPGAPLARPVDERVWTGQKYSSGTSDNRIIPPRTLGMGYWSDPTTITWKGINCTIYTKVTRGDSITVGDVEVGFKESDVIIEQDCSFPDVHIATIEPRNAISRWDGDQLTMWSCVHKPEEGLSNIDKIGLTSSKVRIIAPFSGGSFGSKRAATRERIMTAFISMKTGRPVRSFYSEEEHFLKSGRRPQQLMNIKAGFKKDGTLRSLYYKAIMDNGANGGRQPWSLCARPTMQLYPRNPNVLLEGTYVSTNTDWSAEWRGYATIQPTFCVQMMMDEAAEKLGIDPIALTLKNLAQAGDPLRGGWASAGQFISSVGIPECLDAGAKAIGWEKRKNPGETIVSPTMKRGLGTAIYFHSSGGALAGKPPIPGAYAEFMNASAIVRMYGDGTFVLQAGFADLGQGTLTSQLQLVAEELGVSYEDVGGVFGESDACPQSVVASSSSTMTLGGYATIMAARDLKLKLFNVAADMLKVKPEDLESGDGRIYVKGSPETGVTMKDVAATRTANPSFLIGSYSGRLPYGPTPREQGAQFIEAEVDIETGLATITRMIAVADAGRACNPSIVEGQTEGALITAIGSTFFEDQIWDKQTGKLLNCNFIDYKIPTHLDIPKIEVIIVEKHDPCHPYGMHGCSEGSVNPTNAAIVNAVYNAIGTRLLHPPLTPNKILQALGTI
ncbi:xanthine dehydrogenase family protein molybdopterin-binding subunit [Chloroflexota bacterium]